MARAITGIGLASFMVGLLAWTACGTETGNPEGTVLELEYNARSSAPAQVGLNGDAGGAVVEAVWLRLEPVELVACDGMDTVKFVALGLADHSGADAAVQMRDVPDRAYCTVRVGFHTAETATGAPAITDGASIALTGQLASGRPFSIAVPDDVGVALILAQEAPPELGAWLLSFDVATWIDTEVLDTIPGDSVVVSRLEHPDVLDGVVDRLADGIALYHDVNVSGTVDPGERRLD